MSTGSIITMIVVCGFFIGGFGAILIKIQKSEQH